MSCIAPKERCGWCSDRLTGTVLLNVPFVSGIAEAIAAPSPMPDSGSAKIWVFCRAGTPLCGQARIVLILLMRKNQCKS